MSKGLLGATIWIALTQPLSVCADQIVRSYVMGLSAAADSANGVSAGALIDYGWNERTRVSADVSYTRADTDVETLNATQWNTAIDREFKAFGITARIGQWGDRDAFRANVFSTGLYKTYSHGRLGVEWIRRDLNLRFQSPQIATRQSNVSVGSEGLTLQTSASTQTGKTVWLSASRYHYNRPVDRLDTFRLARLLAPSALTLSGTLLDHSVSMGADWPVGNNSLSLTIGSDRTAIDRQDVHSASLGWLTPLNKRTELDVSIGASRDRIDTHYFVSVLLLSYGLQ